MLDGLLSKFRPGLGPQEADTNRAPRFGLPRNSVNFSAAMAAWRQMTVDDVDGLLRVADEVHPDLPEGGHIFAERVKLFPEGCLVLADDDEILGYAISHPIRRNQPPELDCLLGEIAADADQYYIHDVAVRAKTRGKGFAAECINKLLEIARRYPTSCLVSVYGTAPFWGRFGFELEPVDDVLKAKLKNYGDDAIYLSRRNGQ